MAFEQTSVQDRRPQPGLALNLSANNTHLASNNPFRRNISPAPRSSGSFTQSPPITEDRRKSTNPFLDTYRADAPAPPMPTRRSQSPSKVANGLSFERPPGRATKHKEPDVAEMLIDLSLIDQNSSARNVSSRAPGGDMSSNSAHRTTHSNEEKRDMKAAEKAALDIFETSNGATENRRPVQRRNSDSSMFDAKEEERRRRERRRRERDARDKSGKDGRPRPSRNRRAQGLDIIDKLDVTGLYGPGMIHHDGPFDACNPHRNRKNARTAPMQAFPAGSLNNALGGSGPVKKSIDLDAYHGRVIEGFSDYNKTSQPEAAYDPYAHSKKPSQQGAHNHTMSWDAKEKIEPVHGEASAGLGTSTFLEGTQVSRKDIVRRESETEETPLNPGGGLSRKRSIAQKIRGISKHRPGIIDSTAVASTEGRFVQSPTSPNFVHGTQSAGGRDRMYERNPFFQDQTVDVKKGPPVSAAAISAQMATTGAAGRPRTASSPKQTCERAPSSPRRDLYRTNTQEDQHGMPSKESGSGNGNGGGIIGRVKSLRSKKRPERLGGANVGAANA